MTEANINKSEKKNFRIRLRLHYTWVFVFLFIIGIVTTQYPESYSFPRRILLGIAASLVFLLLIIIRQLALNYIAGHRNIIFRRVTLYIYGGVPGIMREFTSPVLEFLLGATGLMVNLLITVILYSVYIVLVVIGNTLFGNIIAWMTSVFFLFTVFHFIPAYPLDTGRILRALIWRITHNYDRATVIASWIGQGFGIFCVVVGIVLLILNQKWFSGLSLFLSGWALSLATVHIKRNIVLKRSLKELTVLDVMSRQYPFAGHQMSIGKIIREYSLMSGQHYFMVVAEDRLLGSINLKNLQSVPRRLRERTRVEKVMVPSRHILVAYPGQSAADACEQMVEMEIDEMPVIEDGKVIGVVFKEKLSRLATIRTTLRM
ncbi:MAG: CBS domain-containing protein [Dehalococcoidales bacterium]|nr:CBS domain-containing protein [Dehalococcoidales bacterium]